MTPAPGSSGLVKLAHRLFPVVGGKGASVSIGPLPAGMPIGLITNIDITGGELSTEEKKAHKKQLGVLLQRVKGELAKNPDLGTVLNSLTDDLLAVSKCKDLVVNKGHYFGTSWQPDEAPLSDADKRALIAFLKTF